MNIALLHKCVIVSVNGLSRDEIHKYSEFLIENHIFPDVMEPGSNGITNHAFETNDSEKIRKFLKDNKIAVEDI